MQGAPGDEFRHQQDGLARDRNRESADADNNLVAVGGSGVGSDLLRRVIAAFPQAKRLVPELRMIVVAGPRIAPQVLPAADGLEIRP